jgi:hypothetical protein
VKVGRNEPCPCGSGLKVKRCCGVDGVLDRERRAADAASDLLSLAYFFPRCRPVSAAFDEWARTAPEEFSPGALEDGLAELDPDERERIVGGFRADHPTLWSDVVADFRNEQLAVELVLRGVVVIGVSERRQPMDGEGLEMLEQDAGARVDPADVLAYVLDCRGLWSVIESYQAVDALDEADDAAAERVLAATAEGLATAWHHDRLRVLVDRIRPYLPLPMYPLASQAVADACDRFDADAAFRRRLLAELLLDSLDEALPPPLAAAA